MHACMCVCARARVGVGCGGCRAGWGLCKYYSHPSLCTLTMESKDLLGGPGFPRRGRGQELGSPCQPLPRTALTQKGQAWLTHANSLGPSRSCSPGTHGQETRENRETPRCSQTQAVGTHSQAPCATESRTTLGGRCHRVRSEPRL